MRLDSKKILRQERKPFVQSQDYLKQYNKCWIAQDDSGTIVGTNKTFDPVRLCDELHKKYRSINFKLIYVDIPEKA